MLDAIAEGESVFEFDVWKSPARKKLYSKVFTFEEFLNRCTARCLVNQAAVILQPQFLVSENIAHVNIIVTIRIQLLLREDARQCETDEQRDTTESSHSASLY